MKIKNKGYIVPVAIGVLVVASLGLLMSSLWSKPSKTTPPTVSIKKTVSKVSIVPDSNLDNKSPANDDATLDADSAAIDAQLKVLDKSSLDVDNSLNDKSSF